MNARKFFFKSEVEGVRARRVMDTDHSLGQKKVVSSAVVIIPPEEVWGPIQEIRKVHDKAYHRWMPHINLLYPFVPAEDFEDVVDKAKQALRALAPFRLSFKTFDYFPHGTMWLKPDTPAQEVHTLQSKLEEAFPFCNDLSTMSEQGFTPHLSVGQWPKGKIKQVVQEFQSRWNPIEFDVKEVYFIARPDQVTPFKIHFRIPLGNAPVETRFSVNKEEVQKRRAEEKKLTAFVSNLSFKATTEEVEEFFQANGLNPVNVTIATGPGGRSRGFGFVKFGSESEVQTAVTEMNNKPFQGRIIGVSPAREH